ncbi:MAG: hypothetical protein LBC59_09370 [Chitinispirillales bacterium]|jgi:hypothetical protein|nr:hypothetical protein [Chitinispirillales bacterium]
MITKLAKYADLLLLVSGVVLLTVGLIRVGLTGLLIGGGVALVVLGVYKGRG